MPPEPALAASVVASTSRLALAPVAPMPPAASGALSVTVAPVTSVVVPASPSVMLVERAVRVAS